MIKLKYMNKKITLIEILLFVFCEGNLFCLSPFLKIGNFSYKIFSEESGLPKSFINSIIQEKNGGIFIATNLGLFYFDGFEFETINLNWFTSLAIDKKGTIWAGTYGNGLIKIIKEKEKWNFQEIHLFKNEVIYSLKIDSNNFLYVGTNEKGLFKFDIKNGIAEKIEELGDKTIWSIFLDSLGRVWISASNSLFKIEKGKIEKILSLAPSFSIFSISENSKKEILFGTNGGGIYILKNKGLSYFFEKITIPLKVVTSILISRDKNLIVGGDSGLYKINCNIFEKISFKNICNIHF